MAAVAGGGTRRADGLIDPDGIPGVDMAPELIRSAAWTLASASAGVSQHGATAVTKWQTMSTVYEAPESEALLAVMGPVGQETTALADGFTKVGKALTDFADTVAPIVAKLVELKAEAVAFVAQAEQGYDMPAIGPQPTTQLTDYGSVQSSPGGMYSAPAHHVEWTEYAPYSQRNDKLIMAVATLATALDEAQADCVNKIAAAHPPANSCPQTVHGTDFTTAAKEGKPLPFGQTAAGRPNCVTSFGGGVGDAAKGMVEGLGSLVSYNPETRQWGDWDHAGKAALGVVEGLGSLIAPTPLFQVLADDSSGVTPGWMRDFSKSTLDKQQQMVDGFVGSKEQWETDPARAAGSLFVNVGSLFIPGAGEVAAGAKVVSVGARVASVGGRVAEAADAASIAGRVVGAGARASVVAGSGLVRVGDLMTQVAARADALGHAATAPVMNALRDAVDRVPHVEVAVRHVVTPDGYRIPTLHVEVGDSARTRAMSNAADAGDAASHRAEPGTVQDGHGGVGHADHDPGAVHESSHPGADPTHEPSAHDAGGAHGHEHHEGSSAHAGNVDDVPQWLNKLLDRPDISWKTRRLFEGIRFNYERHRFFPHNEVRLADGSRVDSYIPDVEIVSRKYTQLSDILDRTAKDYIDELRIKYAPGKQIAHVSDRHGPPRIFADANKILGGDELQGASVLEIPPQVKPIPEDVLKYATEHDVVIRDATGHIYNPLE